MRFIFDHNLSPNLARALNHLVDDEVTCLRDCGWQADTDEEWIPKLAEEGGWIILTCDLDIIRNPFRQVVFRKAGLTAFFLIGAWSGGMHGTEIAQRLLKVWPEIAKRAATSAAGTCFKVPLKGVIQRFSPQGKRPI